LDILGNVTRRKILSALSDEPMYFNQLAKELGIGQQSILRHMQALEEGGIVKTYEEKSDLGAPNRKYYCLSSVFSLNISMSQDSFSIAPHIIQKRNNDKNNDNYKRQLKTSEVNQKGSINTEIDLVRKNLLIVEDEISDLESRLDDLRALKQIALHKLHEIGKDNFEHLERRILYRTIEDQSLTSISKLADVLDETESHVRDAVTRLQKKLDKDSIKLLFS
jgi:ArsR family transcriptional regulator